ncbi:peptidase dimerization domain-containing protein [Nocardiopsis sp. JB363]|uniref:peptidase dimerization domain-containing protein n=1 Tax=Nocardiopsis sp. JB363 TaxID=1434837 RepID=UPI001F329CE8|nr:peptidase dimerization domain-containing protein [Nocardiopsis sp. JB363]
MLVRANVGVIWFNVRVAGRPTHPREMSSGLNAIDAAHHVLGRLRELELRWNQEKGDHPFFEDLDHPINFNLGGINGGDWPSSVPAWCELQVRAAIDPGVSADYAWEQIQAVLRSTVTNDSGHPIEAVGERTGRATSCPRARTRRTPCVGHTRPSSRTSCAPSPPPVTSTDAFTPSTREFPHWSMVRSPRPSMGTTSGSTSSPCGGSPSPSLCSSPNGAVSPRFPDGVLT